MQSSSLCLAAAVVAVAFLVQRGRRSVRRRLALVHDDHGNEALVVDADLDGLHTLFLVDTAYAGAPVISTSLLAVERGVAGADLQRRYADCLRRLREEAPDASRHQSVHRRLLRTGRCRSFVSGCTMRLMGIGETSEAQADLLLCPALHIDGASNAVRDDAGDVFVTNPLRGSPHILTMDYLLHRAPCVLRPRAGAVHFALPALEGAMMAHGFHFFKARFVGGAFVLPVTVGGATLQIVLDTGAGAALSLAKQAADRIVECSRAPGDGLHATQMGVHGERVCSDVLVASVSIGALSLDGVQVFVNSHDVQGADGYAGMGLLRAFDLWLEPARVGLRPSGLPPRSSTSLTPGRCGGDRALPRCTAK